ncbi:MAG: amidohydrolase family protein [Caldilineaceae bacterium]|nr:amidohydrolase family protein [Caldilineaceae bacterium]
MSPRLDAHAHFFYPGYVGKLPENCRRQSPDEITLYQAHAQHHEIAQVLAIGYEGDAWASGNNQYLAELTAQLPFVRPLAFVAEPSKLTVAQLSIWQSQHFVGITLYLFTDEAVAQLGEVADDVWRWLEEHAWLISVNSKDDLWTHWEPILNHHPALHLLVAHLGLPPATETPLPIEDARTALAPVLRLASFPSTYVKFSGFYALASPDYAFPHRAAFPYAQAVTEAFGTRRILWASDFSPALESVSFSQTVAVLQAMSWLTEEALNAIYHDNLARLLAKIEERNSLP